MDLCVKIPLDKGDAETNIFLYEPKVSKNMELMMNNNQLNTYKTISKTVRKINKKDLLISTNKFKPAEELISKRHHFKQADFNTAYSNFADQAKKNNYKIPAEDKEVAKLAIALFYSNDGIKLPKIYEVMNDSVVEFEPLRDYCTKLKNKLQNINIDKYNMILKNQENFHLLIINAIDVAIGHIQRIIEVSPLEDIADIYNKINNVTIEIEDIKYGLKGGSLVTTSSNSLIRNAEFITLTGGNFFSALGPYINIIGEEPTGGESKNISPIELNTLSQVNAGILWALTKGGLTIGVANYQTLGLYKQYLCYLIKRLYNLGGKLSKAEEKNIGKFLNIKRGIGLSNAVKNLFMKVFKQSTTSAKNFKNTIAPQNQLNNSKPAYPEEDNNHIQQEEKNDNIKVLQRQAKSFITIKAEIKQKIKLKQFNALNVYINSLSLDEQTLIPDMVFKIGKFRAGVLAHLQKLYCTKKGSQPPNNTLSTVEMIVQRSPLVTQLCGKEYNDLYLFLKNFQANNKFTALLDFSHILFAISKNNNLSSEEKDSLIRCLETELNQKSNGNYVNTRIKRSAIITNAGLASLAYQGLNFKRDTQEILAQVNAAYVNNIVANTIASSAGWASFSLLAPLSEYFSKGNTITYNSLVTILKTTKQVNNNPKSNSRQSLISLDSNPQLKNEINQKYENPNQEKILPANLLLNKKAIVQDIRREIFSLIKENKFDEIITRLEVLKDNKLIYNVLTEKINDTFLLDELFKKIIETKIKDNMFNRLRQVWYTCINSNNVINNRQDLGKLDFSAFKVHIGNQVSNTASQTLLNYYTIISIISQDTEDIRKLRKLQYFAEIISRAKIDNTSKWYSLRKRTANQELLFRSLVRITGALLWGGAATALTMSGVGIPILVPLLIICDGIRGVLYGVANNFSHTNTIEYKTAKKITNLLLDEIVDQQQIEELNNQVFEKINKHKSKIQYPPLVKVVNLGHNDKLFELFNDKLDNISNLQHYFDQKTDFSEDDKFIDQLNLADGEIEILESVQNIVTTISAEVVDKYLANQAIFRIARIISLSTLPAITKLKLSLTITFLFKERILNVALLASKERDFSRRQKYFLPWFVFGITAASTSLSGVGVQPISAIYQTLIGTTGDIIGSLSLNLLLNEYTKNNTNSYHLDMEFLKYWIIDNYLLASFSITKVKEMQEYISRRYQTGINGIKQEAYEEQLTDLKKMKKQVDLLLSVNTNRNKTNNKTMLEEFHRLLDFHENV